MRSSKTVLAIRASILQGTDRQDLRDWRSVEALDLRKLHMFRQRTAPF